MEKSTKLLSALSSNNTPTMWRFLIKAPHLGKFSVMCDAENNLSSDENRIAIVVERRSAHLLNNA